ncbi:AAA family ATPase [Scleromatobacter humisilvae]|uniref:AAA family ATPase n=1 Tax=Scleromatobacter humisilvae TaxID=2897159 RepID=A0A9X1YSQ6_9BURK|nr:AAA family ATPase [Scleromatobacter humisilvae]MCK9688761.1 AAA family ATPase [Scleromatobacter humisilvae]
MVQTQFVGRVTLLRERVGSFDAYPFCLPVVRALESFDLHPKVTFLVGENGSGKSTLLEAMAIALEFNPEGGSRNFNFATRASHSELHDYLRIAKGYRRHRDGFFLRAESWFNVATEVDNLGVSGSYGGRSLHEQSHGESFMALLKNRFGPDGLYLLDEPEAALSPARQIEALSRLHELVLQDSQFIIATHSPILMSYPDALILHCGPTGLQAIRYEDTEHFRITRDFLLHRDKMLDILMDR